MSSGAILSLNCIRGCSDQRYLFHSFSIGTKCPLISLPDAAFDFENNLWSYAENLLSNYITGYPKLYRSALSCKKVRNWKSALEKNESVCAFEMLLAKLKS